MNWEKLFLKYVWNEQTMPYLVPVEKLNRRQGNSEILIYTLFLGVFFGAAALLSLRGGPDGRSLGIAFYGFSVVCAAALFVIMKNYPAALYLSATPAVALVYLYAYGLGSEREAVDTVIVTVILILLLRYSLRIVAIARAYPEFPDTSPDET
jgi:hypothetical protein